MHQTGKFARALCQPWDKAYENQIELAGKYLPVSQKCHFLNFNILFSLCHTEMKLDAFNYFNLKKCRSMAFISLLSRHLLRDVGGECPNTKAKSSRRGTGPQLQQSLPCWMPHSRKLLSALVHWLLFLTEIPLWTWEMVIVERFVKLFQWKLQRKVSVSTNLLFSSGKTFH